MFTLGIDLATKPAGTAIARIDWGRARPKVVQVCQESVPGGGTDTRDLDDEVLVELVKATLDVGGAVGIDCPFGWPESFRAMLTHHAEDTLDATEDHGGQWRQQNAYRQTDIAVAKAVAEHKNASDAPLWRKKTPHTMEGNLPLSPAADRLSLTTMRLASILALLRENGVSVDRSDVHGAVVEVYPAASLAMWDLSKKGYKNKKGNGVEARTRLLAVFLTFLDMDPEAQQLCQESDDALDAVIASLSARAAQLHHVTHVPDEFQAQTQREGWIALPTCGLADLPNRQTSPALEEPAVDDTSQPDWQVPDTRRATDLDPWEESILTCRQCGWSGPGSTATQELFDYLLQVDCPECEGRLLLVGLPSDEDIRRQAAAGNPRAVARMPEVLRREEFFARVEREKLQDATVLPDLTGDDLDFVLTISDSHRLVLLHDTHGRSVGSGWGHDWRDINPENIEAGQPGVLTLHTESAPYEDLEPLFRIIRLLEARYEDRFRYIDPWEAAGWLRGDDLWLDARDLGAHAKPRPPANP